jgi:hypothetical protein
MKGLGVFFLVLLLGGCATAPTLEELEDQALLTGDWSHVEKRERTIARREAEEPLECASGYMSYCETRIATTRCSCVSRSVMRDVFRQF